MKRISVPVPSAPVLIGLVFALLVALVSVIFTGGLISSAASPASVQSADPNVITGCVGGSNPGNSALALSGRSITASTLLRVDPSGTCSASETPVTWNAQGPQGLQGPKGDPIFTHTYVVTTTTDAVNNGNRLLSVMTTISNSSPTYTNTNLVKLEPGTFDLGSNSITLTNGVNLEGSGQDISVVISSVGSATSLTNGVINMLGRSTAVRDLTIENKVLTRYNAGIYSTGFFSKISDVSIYASCNSGPACEVAPSLEVYGVYLTPTAHTLIQNTLINTNASYNLNSIGVYNGGYLEIQNSTLIIVSGNNTYGIKVDGGDINLNGTDIEQTTIQAQWGGMNTALYVQGPNVKVKNSTLAGYSSADHNSTAIYNNYSGTTVQNSTMQVLVSTNSTPNYAITNPGTLKVGNSQVDGAVNNTGTIKCVASYDTNYDPIANVNTCS